MKKFHYILVVFCLLLFLYWLLKPIPVAIPVYLSPKDKLIPIKPTHEVYKYIEEINEKNLKIKNISVEKIQIELQQLAIKTFGCLAMQKENNFRLKVWTVFGLEMDVGSNDQHFWFWSKRMSNPALYYSKHENLNKTMLKTPLNPSWLIESLNFGKISIENIEISKFKNFWMIIQPRISALGEKVVVITLIDPQKMVVSGHYLYKNNFLIASTEILEFTLDSKTNLLIPRKVLIIWHDEKISLKLELINAQINTSIQSQFWIMPDIKNKIDIGS